MCDRLSFFIAFGLAMPLRRALQQECNNHWSYSTRTQAHTRRSVKGAWAWADASGKGKDTQTQSPIRYKMNALFAGYCHEGFLLRATRTPTSTRYFSVWWQFLYVYSDGFLGSCNYLKRTLESFSFLKKIITRTQEPVGINI